MNWSFSAAAALKEAAALLSLENLAALEWKALLIQRIREIRSAFLSFNTAKCCQASKLISERKEEPNLDGQ